MQSVYIRPFVTRFVTLFVERSGSTYLATLLDSHPAILSKREEFAHLRQRGIGAEGQLEWARDFWKPSLFGLNKAIGFKTKMEDILDQDGFAGLLRTQGVRIIQLQRRNIVKAVISTMNAKRLYEKSGNWNLLKETDRLPTFRVDPDEFDYLLNERIRWDWDLENFVRRLENPCLQIFYEDLLRNESGLLSKIFNFLNVKHRPVHGKTFKNTSDDLREVVQNFGEIRQQYSGTRFQSMFDEVIT